MNRLRVILVLAVYLIIGSYALNYSLLEEMEMTCPSSDNCVMIEEHGTKFEDRSCECDSQCHDFRDCCIDKANFEPSRTKKYSCFIFNDRKKIGVYVVDTCPENYVDSIAIKHLCQGGDDFRDPLMSAPVTDVSTNTTFKNRFCAECNGAFPSSLESWQVYMNCEAVFPLDTIHIWRNVEYNRSLSTWGVKVDDEFHKCKLMFEKPENMSGVPFCRPSKINSCPTSYPEDSVKRLCESYSAVVYDMVTSYKNPHCAICNNKRVDDLSCIDPSIFINKKIVFTFPHLLDVNRFKGNLVGTVEKCPNGEQWDPFFKKCRKLTCALPGYKIVSGKCRRV